MVGISKAEKDASFYRCISGADGEYDHEFCFEFPASGGKSRLHISYERNRTNVDALENSLFDRDFMETWEQVPILLAKHLPTLPEDRPSVYAFQLVNSSFTPCEAPKVIINGHHNYRIFQEQDLKRIRDLGSRYNVRLVSFAGNQEYMAYKSARFRDELDHIGQELSNYHLLRGLPSVPRIFGIVSIGRYPCGFLMEAFTKGDLRGQYDASVREKTKWAWQLLLIVCQFEEKGFNHEDLKCANIVLDNDDDIKVIDFANSGWTDGFSHPRLEGCQVFSMGKTVLELFTKEHPKEGTVQEDIKEQFEGLIGEMIWMCCGSLEDIPSAREVKEHLLHLAAKEHLLAQ